MAGAIVYKGKIIGRVSSPDDMPRIGDYIFDNPDAYERVVCAPDTDFVAVGGEEIPARGFRNMLMGHTISIMKRILLYDIPHGNKPESVFVFLRGEVNYESLKNLIEQRQSAASID